MFAIPQAIKHRKRLLLTLSGLLAILLAIGGVLYWHSRESLLEFVDQDLRKLDDCQETGLRKLLSEYLPEAFPGPRTRLTRALDRILPNAFKPKQLTNFFGRLSGFETWYIWRLDTDTSPRLVIFQASSLRMMPDGSEAALHFLDANGKYEGHSVLSIDWDNITDATLLHHKLLDAPALEITTSRWFSAVKGPNRRIYALFENRVALLRTEDGNGNLVAGRGDFDHVRLRHPPVIRTAEEWEEQLLSSDRRHILEALNWIGGEDWIGPNDDVRDAVRKRPAVQRRIGELTLSENRWLREAAVFAQKALPK